jgi:gluconate 2-dehydrogenase gamma chain
MSAGIDVEHTLCAVVQRILPSDGDADGAKEAAVVSYFAWARSQAWFRGESRLQEGLALIEAVSRARFQRSFPECTAALQDVILREIESLPSRAVQKFWSMMINMTIAGFLCDPRYGGNRECLGWRFIDFAVDVRAEGRDVTEA